MRYEKDALGDLPLTDGNFFGIGTARLIGAAAVSGPAFPPEIPRNIVRVRQAQAIAFGRNRLWSATAADAVEKAAARIATGGFAMEEHLKVLPLHGGGARSIILNVDEILANVALEGMGGSKGEYHLLANLFQTDRGNNHLQTYMTAVHMTLIEEMSSLCETAASLSERLKSQEGCFRAQPTIDTVQFQPVEISDIGAEFGRCYESLQRTRLQLDWVRAQLLPCWQGPSDALLALRELVGIDLAISKDSHDFPWNLDLYVGFSALLKSAALMVLQFCNRMRLRIGETKELDLQLIRANPPFNPAGRDFLILDTVSQLMFSIIGGDAVIVASAGGGIDSPVAYAPLYSSQLVWCEKWMTTALKLLDEKFVANLTGNPEGGKRRLSETPLQAERLISVLGYDRAVQVARIAALTEKPVRLVVRKMKLLTDEETDRCFSGPDDDET